MRAISCSGEPIVRYIQELERTGFIKIVRLGQGKPNLYELNLTIKKKAG